MVSIGASPMGAACCWCAVLSACPHVPRRSFSHAFRHRPFPKRRMSLREGTFVSSRRNVCPFPKGRNLPAGEMPPEFTRGEAEHTTSEGRSASTIGNAGTASEGAQTNLHPISWRIGRRWREEGAAVQALPSLVFRKEESDYSMKFDTLRFMIFPWNAPVRWRGKTRVR